MIFYNFSKNFKDKIGSKYTPKLHHLKKTLGGGACPRTPLAKRMASPCKFLNLKKKLLPPPESWLRPCLTPPPHLYIRNYKNMKALTSNLSGRQFHDVL